MPHRPSRNDLLPLRQQRTYFDTTLRYRARRELRAGLAVVVYERSNPASKAPEELQWRRLGSAYAWPDALAFVQEHRLAAEHAADGNPAEDSAGNPTGNQAENPTGNPGTSPGSRQDGPRIDIDLTENGWAERPLRQSEAP